MIRAAVFDLGGVLEIVDDDRWLPEWVSRWEHAAGVEAGSYARATATMPPMSSEGELRRRLQNSLALTDRDADRAISEFWDAYCGELDVEMRDFVRELAASMTVAALSNSADGARREDDRRYGFGGLFDLLVYSHEVGMEKPDAAIYRHTQAALGIGAHEIVFVDDRESAVEGARAVGWHAVRHESTPQSFTAVRTIIDEQRAEP
jgi:HAD superfamily hydrolase (TIGR01549 family)